MNHFLSPLCLFRDADAVILRPSLSAGISVYHKKSGEQIGPKTIRLSWAMTLWQAVFAMVGILMTVKLIGMLCRLHWQSMGKKKAKKKWKRMWKK
jgi:hypothetical protein